MLSGSDAGGTLEEVGSPETESLRFKLGSVEPWDSANDALHEGSQQDPSRLVRRVIVKPRRIHKLLTGRKNLAIQQHLIVPSRENSTHLRRERSSIRLRGAVPPEDAGSQYQLPLDEIFPGKTTTEHARKTDNRRSRADHGRHVRPASKLSTKGQTFPTPKGLPNEGCSTRR